MIGIFVLKNWVYPKKVNRETDDPSIFGTDQGFDPDHPLPGQTRLSERSESPCLKAVQAKKSQKCIDRICPVVSKKNTISVELAMTFPQHNPI